MVWFSSLRSTLLVILVLFHSTAASEPLPYRFEAMKDLTLISVATALLVAPELDLREKRALGEDELQDLDPADLNSVDRWMLGQWSPALNRSREVLEYTAPFALGLGLGGYVLATGEQPGLVRRSLTLMALYVEGLALNVGLIHCSKYFVDRPRPYTYDRSLSTSEKLDPENRESFFSGNAAHLWYHAVFASLVTQDLSGDGPLAKGVLLAGGVLATTAGLMTLLSGQHFLTDVLVGAAAGSGCAVLVLEAHGSGQSVRLTPLLLPDGKGVAVSANW